MRILFTGASSFTGYWFVWQLVQAGHEVGVTFTRSCAAAYEGLRAKRVRRTEQTVTHSAYSCGFGGNSFLRLIADFRPELLCHHAADVTDYKSKAFDVSNAFANNTYNLRQVLHALSDAACNRLILTGSLFEGGEGVGSDGLPHFSPYGLSKSLTAAAFQHFCRVHEFSLGKFVVPNPFGPYEDPRFTAYLIRCWRLGETATVKTPLYVRDNIHVSLLAKHYRAFADRLPLMTGFVKTNPSGYVESQGAFADRFAAEMRSRLNLACDVASVRQTDFSEPQTRINTEPVDGVDLDWNEADAWNELADFYLSEECIS